MPKPKNRDGRPRARLDWDDVRVFAAVAAAGSVNQAATELKMVASSVSRHIDDLERKLEVKLFRRSTTGMTLTAAGEDIYDRARSMRHIADEIEDSVRARDTREEGRVVISAPDGVGSLWVAPRLSAFLQRNPKIQISLDCQIGPNVDLDNRADITIALNESQAQIGDDASALATMHYVFLAAPSYIETYGTPTSLASAAGDHRTLRQTGQVSQRDTWDRKAAAVEALADFSFETNSSAAFMSALASGAGVGTAPTYVLQRWPELVLVGSDRSVPIKLWLIVHKESRNAARVLRVSEWLRSIFDARTNPWFRAEFVHPTDFGAATASDAGNRATPAPRRRRS